MNNPRKNEITSFFNHIALAFCLVFTQMCRPDILIQIILVSNTVQYLQSSGINYMHKKKCSLTEQCQISGTFD